MASYNFVIADAGASQSLLLDGIACRGCALVVGAALILDRVARLTFLIHQEEVNPFRVHAAVCFRIVAPQNFAQRNLGHYLPCQIAAQNHLVELLEHARFFLVEKWLGREAGAHNGPQLICRIWLL